MLIAGPAQARQRAPEQVAVPRAGAEVMIDGRLDSGEWARAAVRAFSDGAMLRFQHDGRHLFVGISAARPGFASLCLAQGDSVRVLHASAALGSVRYGPGAEGWSTADTAFAFGMRGTDTTAQGRRERAEYLARRGWVATTFGMSGGRAHEMQIAIGPGVPRLALAFFVPLTDTTWDIVAWPPPGEPAGCAEPSLVRGTVPRRLQFKPLEWAELRLDP